MTDSRIAMNALGVVGDVAGHFDFGIEAQDVALFVVRPQGEAGDDGGAGVMRDLGESAFRRRPCVPKKSMKTPSCERVF